MNEIEDVYSGLRNLREAYLTYQIRVAGVKAEIREKYKKLEREEIARKVQEEEQAFANLIRDGVEKGIRVTQIQREVLRTNAWNSWTKWRDLAGLPSRNRKTEEEYF